MAMTNMNQLAVNNGAGFFTQPINTPELLSLSQASNAFDRDDRIFIVPVRNRLHPNDQFDAGRLFYSYTWADWWRYILPANATKAAKKPRLWYVFERIIDHARKQCKNPAQHRLDRLHAYLDFYRFVPPEIQRVETVTPQAGLPFELRWAEWGRYWYFNWYARTPLAQRRGRK